jgi:hypothetical protein
MLQKLSEEIAEWYAHASHCRERARRALDRATKRDFLQMERRWLSLACSYELAERISDFTARFTKGHLEKWDWRGSRKSDSSTPR